MCNGMCDSPVATRHACSCVLVRSGESAGMCGWYRVHQERRITSVAAMNSRLFCNHWSPMLKVPCPWVRSIIIVATDTGDSDP